MACNSLTVNNFQEFLQLMEDRDADLVLKMVKCVLKAYKQNKKQVDIFEINIENGEQVIYSMEKHQYVEFLDECIQDLIQMEEYELCNNIKQIKQKQI